MDGFTYQNIFDTKGMEYLVVIVFFLFLIPFWVILNRKVKITREIQKTLRTITANTLRIPQGLFYNRNHTWTYLEKSGHAKVGIDDLLQHLTGEIRFSSTREKGEKIKKGELMALMSHNGKQLKIFSPLSGEISEINPEIASSPEILNVDPFSRGWLFKIRPSRWIAETSSCYLAEEATKWSNRELERFKDFLASSVEKYSANSNIVLQDGGELIDRPLSELSAEVWDDFQQNFLNVNTNN